LWIQLILSRYRLFASQKYAIILVFAVCAIIRVIPELVAYPYPIGYDVVNYYIPVVANFDAHWYTISSQFPLYVLFLHFVNIATGLPAASTIASVAVAMFGAFGVSIFFIARSFQLGANQSIFLAIFVIFQMAVLRTTWDLHRDIFALTTMMFVFSLIHGRRQDLNWKWIAVMLVLAALTVAADRMIGALFCVSLAGYTIMARSKPAAMLTAYAAALFSILIIVSFAVSGTGVDDIRVDDIRVVPEKVPAFYNPSNLIVLFAVVDGLLLAPTAIGFLHLKSYLLKIPLLVSLIGSFSWLSFPDNNLLVADRWIILSGIFLSIFAGYGIILSLVKKLKPNLATAVAGSVLIAFAVIGLAYTIMPYDNPFVLYGVARSSIDDFSPVTMQFNSLDIKDNGKLLSTIDWINKNTEPDAVIVGEKHWRGFMELYIGDQRIYRFSNNLKILAESLENQGYHVYLFKLDTKSPTKFVIEAISRG
jgi:hypothetical protein